MSHVRNVSSTHSDQLSVLVFNVSEALLAEQVAGLRAQGIEPIAVRIANGAEAAQGEGRSVSNHQQVMELVREVNPSAVLVDVPLLGNGWDADGAIERAVKRVAPFKPLLLSSPIAKEHVLQNAPQQMSTDESYPSFSSTDYAGIVTTIRDLHARSVEKTS